MKHFIRLLILFLLASGHQLFSQDIHFSMFYASPLTLNPAMTGAGEGSYRAAGIYRNQWRSISTPFNTYSASYDMKLLQDKLPKDIFGVGAVFVGDRSGDGRLTMKSIMVSSAFHKSLDREKRHFLGLGVQLGYTNKSLQYQRLTFPDQFNSGTSTFDINQPSGENISNPNIGYFDMQVGLLHQSNINDMIGVMTGVSIAHITRPRQSFMNDKAERLSTRYTAHAGVRIKVAKSFYINPNIIYQNQNKAQELNLGTSFEYRTTLGKSDFVGSIGGWYRIKDAAIITLGMEYYKVKALFAYDINASSLRPATNNRGAFELAIIYTGIIKSNKVIYPVMVPCPMM
ncbi:MAG: PorP/SprF family type IX secretion system membrane protein [Bacteroidetes bacterium]|nr:PorP/SprF family type IX secretion system membrane protein [Bacteroidota bacterium]